MKTLVSLCDINKAHIKLIKLKSNTHNEQKFNIAKNDDSERDEKGDPKNGYIVADRVE